MIDKILEKIAADKFELSKHAADQLVARNISVNEIKEAVVTGEIIEDYPNDKYGPSCLIFGKAHSGRPLHIQTSYTSRPLLKIVTFYEPDPARWINFRRRRR